MRKLLGLILAGFGLVFGHAAYQNAPTHREDQLAEVTRILTNPGIETSAAAAQRTPKQAITTAPSAVTETPAKVADARQPLAAPASAPLPTAWQTSVAAETARPGTTSGVTSVVPGDSSARRELVRALQTELKRVGCFAGDATGNWSPKSKRALAQFMERVNASLPVEDPDYIQLTLLQGQSGTICGRDCPKGQSQSSNGHCVPSAILAQAERQPDSRKPAETASAATWSVETRGGDAAEADGTPKLSGRRIETARADPAGELPWARKTPRRVDQLHGRMSVGGLSPADTPSTGAGRMANLEDAGAYDSVESIPAGALDAMTSDSAPGDDGSSGVGRPAEQVAALAAVDPAGNTLAAQRDLTPNGRIAVPKAYYARPQKTSARAQKGKNAGNYRPQRSVQNLFTHPLGHM